ncbi:16 kda calcium binding protein [Echinococcus multilocularis]|uniref:16 kDa calcium binding protein n=1 Tax=Echinococcus multilocularis TaxID=6211 RepID=A0A068Y2N3_ECHMU|nr:16 kda calcium binding protein [Echinococcus multilocularis]
MSITNQRDCMIVMPRARLSNQQFTICELPDPKMAKYTNEERYRLLQKFNDMDINCDGSLSKDEIRQCCEESNLPPSKVEEFINLFDNNGDSRVTLDEYERALGLKEVPPTTIEEWKAAFEEMDVDKSGKLTVDELYEGLRRIGCEIPKQEVVQIVHSADKDGDHSLTYKEFISLMRL